MDSKPVRLLAVAAAPEGKDAIQSFLGELKDSFAREFQNLEIVGIAYNKRAALRQLESSRADILLIDLMLPGLRSIDIISYVSGTQPDLRILALAPGDPPHDRIILAVQAGALGYVSKDAAPSDIFAAMKQVLRGEIYLPPEETYEVLQLAAPELLVSARERRANLFHVFLGFIPMVGIISALTEFLWREYWGTIGVRVSDLGVDASSRVTEFLITLLVLLGIFGPLLFIPTWIEMAGSWFERRSTSKERADSMREEGPRKPAIARFFFSPGVQWLLLASVLLAVSIPLDISGGKILTIIIGAVIAAVLMAHFIGMEKELPNVLTLPKGKAMGSLGIVGILLMLFMFVLGAEVFLLGPDLRTDGLHGFLAPQVLDLSARPAMIHDLEERHEPMGALYLGGNADLYVLYDPCRKTVRFIPVGSSRVELIDEVTCP